MQMGYLMRKNIRRFLLNGLLKEKHHLTSQQCQPKFILQHVCSLQDLGLFSSGDQREILWIFVFLSCLFSVCTWHHIRFNFMNGLEGQASLISSGNGACKALGPSGSVPCWWGVCSASPARPARLCLRGEVWLRLPRAERGEAALVRALQGMAGTTLQHWQLAVLSSALQMVLCCFSALCWGAPNTVKELVWWWLHGLVSQYSSQLRRLISCSFRTSFKVIPNITQDFFLC